MSVAIWPPISPEGLQIAQETELKRELDWLLEGLHSTLKDLKHGLEDCYALLAPVDPGSTLVLSSHRNEIVKGTVTRVGTRIVKGTLHLRLRTLPAQTLTLNPDHPIHLAPLTNLHALLTHSLDLLALTLAYCYSSGPASPSTPTPTPTPATTTTAHPPEPSPQFIAAQLRLLSQHLNEASSLLRGPGPSTSAGPASEAGPPTDATWTTHSAASSHFRPPLARPVPGAPPPLSFFLAIQDGCLVLWLRSLEPVDAPVNLGTKIALAVGAARRLEHDESERVFDFCCNQGGDGEDGGGRETSSPSQSIRRGWGGSRRGSSAVGADSAGSRPGTRMGSGAGGSRRPSSAWTNSGFRDGSVPRRGAGRLQEEGVEGGAEGEVVQVYVREKVRVESADPSLLSLTAKLTALSHMLDLARRNLAAVMGEELDAEAEEN